MVNVERGQARQRGHIDTEQFQEFDRRLKIETELLQQWFINHSGVFAEGKLQGGFEVEFSLLDKNLNLVPHNLDFIQSLNREFLVPEVGAAHLEINSEHYTLSDDALSKLLQNIRTSWDACQMHAKKNQYELMMIGTPPTASEACHSFDFLTEIDRYYILDSCMAKKREERPIELDIKGKDHLRMQPQCLAMDGLTSALQIHIRIDIQRAVRYYNTAQIIAAPMVALACNSPYLFEHDLWDETRIPVFEQVMTLRTFDHPEGYHSCTFGTGYLQESLFELYEQNYQYFPRLIPEVREDLSPESMWHVRMHNGAIYRWNRPIIDFDPTGRPHLRIEHRPLSSGPTLEDMMANAVFFFGLLHYFATHETPAELVLPFHAAKSNFYQAAQHGLDTQLIWFNGSKRSAQDLILEELIPSASSGLNALGLQQEEINNMLSIIEQRVRMKRTGSSWQRDFIAKNGPDYHALMKEYLQLQKSGKLLHEWTL